jgi:hypothetical protein
MKVVGTPPTAPSRVVSILTPAMMRALDWLAGSGRGRRGRRGDLREIRVSQRTIDALVDANLLDADGRAITPAGWLVRQAYQIGRKRWGCT